MSAAQPRPNRSAAASARPELTVVSTQADSPLAAPTDPLPAAMPGSASANGKGFVASQPTEAVAPKAASLGLPLGGQPPTPEQLDLLRQHSEKLETASPEEIIAWGVEHYFPKLTMATAFGPEGCVIIHMLATVEPRVHVFNIDTQYQFKETLELRDRIAQRYGIVVEYKRPPHTVAEYEAQHGGPVYKHDPDQCCHDNKVTVLQRAAAGWDAWMSAIRRDQSADRAKAPIVGWDKKFSLVKLNPLANWTKQQVWKLITDENIPYNPLHDQGYPSIGCWPCTRAVLFGEDERAGRWSGFAKTECGLHTLEDDTKQS